MINTACPPPHTGVSLQFTSEAHILRNEWRWLATMPDGSSVLLAQLRPELSSEESLRRRYLYETKRLAGLTDLPVSKTIALGPEPDNAAVGPWRLCEAPSGIRLDQWLNERAPAPIDETIALLINIASALQRFHETGFVLRDLEPRNISIGEDGTLRFADIGLARIDILSSLSASSLMLESSAYCAPEHLHATLLDARADLYTLAAIAWQAFTGVLPHDDDSPFLRKYSSLPPLSKLRAQVPAHVESWLRSCLAEDPNDRPSSAQDCIDWLSGDSAGPSQAMVRIACQACGSPMRPGLKLCLKCGKTTVQYSTTTEELGYRILLLSAKEDQDFHYTLRKFYEEVGEEVPTMIGMGIHRSSKLLVWSCARV